MVGPLLGYRLLLCSGDPAARPGGARRADADVADSRFESNGMLGFYLTGVSNEVDFFSTSLDFSDFLSLR